MAVRIVIFKEFEYLQEILDIKNHLDLHESWEFALIGCSSID